MERDCYSYVAGYLAKKETRRQKALPACPITISMAHATRAKHSFSGLIMVDKLQITEKLTNAWHVLNIHYSDTALKTLSLGGFFICIYVSLERGTKHIVSLSFLQIKSTDTGQEVTWNWGCLLKTLRNKIIIIYNVITVFVCLKMERKWILTIC